MTRHPVQGAAVDSSACDRESRVLFDLNAMAALAWSTQRKPCRLTLAPQRLATGTAAIKVRIAPGDPEPLAGRPASPSCRSEASRPGSGDARQTRAARDQARNHSVTPSPPTPPSTLAGLAKGRCRDLSARALQCSQGCIIRLEADRIA